MSNKLVAYFSASGVTKKVAQKISEAIESDIFEITPQELYTKEDLDWTNKQSRSSVEMQNKSSRPATKETIDLDSYDIIILGFPVWWYTAPTIINTFMEENFVENKDIYVFVTSGGSGVTDSFNNLKEQYPNNRWIEGKRLNSGVSEESIKEWIKG
ncbi:MAG: NAD(P)H-dependent oxidoreductase [Methanosphaera sp.]|nr:NAD(P)H-dependent oxidoreductase [Methanosphaera sp.]